jgi:putative MATE family efflux protein
MAVGRPVSRHPDLTTGPIAKTLLFFALPILGSNVLQSINGSANAIWVSHLLGEAALTATANANQIFFLILSGVMGVTLAANVMIGQAAGAGNIELTKRVVGACCFFFVVASAVLGLLGVTFTPFILDLMGTPADARPDAVAYLRVIFATMPMLAFFNFLIMAQRGLGDSRTPFFFSLMSVTTAVLLNPLLIVGWGPLPELGVAGSAAATFIAQVATMAVMLTLLVRRKSILILHRPDWKYLRPDFTLLGTLVNKGVPMSLQMMLVSLSAVTLMSFVNGYGSATAAAYGAVLQIITYVQMPAMALGASVSTMAAQNLGAGRMDRVNRVAGAGVVYALIATATPVLLIYLFEPTILHAFLPRTSPSFEIARHINAEILWGFILFGVSFVFTGVVRANGVVWPPLIIMIAALWGVRVPMAWALEGRFGVDAVWWSFPVGSAAMIIMSAGYFLWGPWRKAGLLSKIVADREAEH